MLINPKKKQNLTRTLNVQLIHIEYKILWIAIVYQRLIIDSRSKIHKKYYLNNLIDLSRRYILCDMELLERTILYKYRHIKKMRGKNVELFHTRNE